MKAKREKNGKISLFLCRDLGSNMLHVSQHDTLKELRKEGKRLLKAGACCAHRLPAREYAYQQSDNSVVFEWI